MCSEDSLSVHIFITVSMSSIGPTLKFLSNVREIYFKKTAKAFTFAELKKYSHQISCEKLSIESVETRLSIFLREKKTFV